VYFGKEDRICRSIVHGGRGGTHISNDPSFIIHYYYYRLQIPVEKCVVIEDSLIGLQAALDAGMKCVITHTPSTKDQDFKGAHSVFPELGESVTAKQLGDIVR